VSFSLEVLKINPEKELKKLSDFIVEQVKVIFRRKGVIVGLSGGIDSACIAAIAVHALGNDKGVVQLASVIFILELLPYISAFNFFVF
jgi:NAD+ synthase